MDGRMDGRTDERTDGRTDGRTNGRTDRRTDGPTDRRTDRRTDGRTHPLIESWLTTKNGFFWSFGAKTQSFGTKAQNTCTSQIQSNLIKPHAQNPETKGYSFAVFSQKLLVILR